MYCAGVSILTTAVPSSILLNPFASAISLIAAASLASNPVPNVSRAKSSNPEAVNAFPLMCGIPVNTVVGSIVCDANVMCQAACI